MWADQSKREEHIKQRDALRKLITNQFMAVRGMATREEMLKAGIDPAAYLAYDKDWYDSSIRGLDVELARLFERLRTNGLRREDRDRVSERSRRRVPGARPDVARPERLRRDGARAAGHAMAGPDQAAPRRRGRAADRRHADAARHQPADAPRRFAGAEPDAAARRRRQGCQWRGVGRQWLEAAAGDHRKAHRKQTGISQQHRGGRHRRRPVEADSQHRRRDGSPRVRAVRRRQGSVRSDEPGGSEPRRREAAGKSARGMAGPWRRPPD